ncbi:hypothetical protein SY88_02220 [Clostridiales bacterium PH28_bin88]|nr:hypothetical protein SY88_02220 [Clostridiales bacterium PH28_bin88]
MAMPEETRRETAVGSDDDFPKYPRGFDFLGYLLQRLDAMEANLRQEVKADISKLETKIDNLQDNLQDRIERVHQETHSITRWAIGIFIALIVGFAAVLLPLLLN